MDNNKTMTEINEATDAALSAAERAKISKRIKSRRKRWEYLFVLSLVAWPIIHFLVFWLYVNFESFTLIFKTYKPLRENTYGAASTTSCVPSRKWFWATIP